MAEITKFRYPGAKNFTTEQTHLFMGRDDDKEKLYQMIDTRQIVVLYGKSGMGKSSLINAGIIPLLENELNQKPKYFLVRLFNKGQEKDASFLPPLQTFIKTVSENATEHEWLKPFKTDAFSKGELWYWLKQWQIECPRVPIILFFDQFEELFSYSDTEIEEFGEELRTLIYQNIPDYISRGKSLTALEQMAFVQQNEKERQATEKQIDAIYEKIEIKLVFSIRSDRMALLNKLTKYIPNILKHFYELDALTEEAAREAIKIPAQIEGDFQTPTFQYKNEVVDTIIERVKSNNDNKIETATLQIILRFIEEQKVLKENIQTITAEVLGDIKNIFRATYQSILKSVSWDTDTVLEISQFIEDSFIQNERRIPFAEEHLIKNYKFTYDILAKLEMSSFLRKERDYAGRYIYEIGHDTWIEPILELKKRREENIEVKNKLKNKIQDEKIKRILIKIPNVIKAIKANKCVLVLGTELCKIDDVNRNRTPKDFHESLEFQYDYFLDSLEESDSFKHEKADRYKRDVFLFLRDTIDIDVLDVYAPVFHSPSSNVYKLAYDFLEWYFQKSDNWINTFSQIVNLPFSLILSLLPDNSFEETFKKKWGKESLMISRFSYRNMGVPIIYEKPTPQKPFLYNLSGNLEYRDSILSFQQWFELFQHIIRRGFPLQIEEVLRECDLIVFLGIKPEKWNMQLLVNFLNITSAEDTGLIFDDHESAFFIQELYQACSREALLRTSKEVSLTSKLSTILRGINIFLVYHHKDVDIAQRLRTDLEESGITIILGTDNPIGFEIPNFINESILKADIIVQLISRDFLTSPWVAQESLRAFLSAEIAHKTVLSCEIDKTLKDETFREKAMSMFDEKIRKISNNIKERLDNDEGIEDLEPQRKRLRELKNNYDSIIAEFRKKNRGDLRGNNYDSGFQKLVESIKEYISKPQA